MAASRRRAPLGALTTLVLAACASRASAQAQLPTGFSDQPVASQLSQPVGMAFMPDGRLLFVEQLTAKIRLLTGMLSGSVVDVGTVAGVNTNGPERGLLGIAVDPGWPLKPYLYVHSTQLAQGGLSTHIAISRFTASGDLGGIADGSFTISAASRYDLVADIPDAAVNHNGGTLRFGLDRMLYVSLGEDADMCAAQDPTKLKGKILRLDVSQLPAGAGVAPRALVAAPGNPFATSPDSNARLVWEFGLRNPFRFQVDAATGELWISDVGENEWEELDHAPAGGLDFGWPYREGPADHTASCAGLVQPALTAPVFFYDRSAVGGGSAVIVCAGRYRAPPGAAYPFPAGYDGDVFASDYYAGHLWRLTGSGDAWVIAPPVPGQPAVDHWAEGLAHVSDYAIGPEGSIYYCVQSGQIRRIVAASSGGSAASPIAVVRPAFPQPSKDAVNLHFTLARQAAVQVSIHDVRGRLVRRLIPRQTRDAGPYPESWDGRDDDRRQVESGLYFAHLVAGGESHEWRIVIAR